MKRSRPRRSRRWRWVTFAVCAAYFTVTTFLPIGQLFVGTFFRFYGFYSYEMLTLEHYVAVWNNPALWRAMSNTLLLAVSGASIVMVLGAVVAFITARTRLPERRLLGVLAWLPWMMPGIVLGVGFLWAFAFLPGPLQIYGTLWALLVAYIALRMPLSVRLMSAAYSQISYDLEECSRVHGATWWQTLWRILVALTFPAFAAGWILAFFGVIRELSASVLLYSVRSEILSVEMLKLWSNGSAGAVGVIGMCLIGLVVLLRWVQLRFLDPHVRAA